MQDTTTQTDTMGASSDYSDTHSNTQITYFSNEFPNGEIPDILRTLEYRSKTNKHPYLAQFLRETIIGIKKEAKDLPKELDSLMPTFETILDLATHPTVRKGQLGGAIDGVLLCTIQIASLIGALEHRGLTSDDDAALRQECIAGMGIGLLASTAASLASTVPELINGGVVAVRLAYRLGVHVDSVSGMLEQREPDGPPSSWAYVVTGHSEKEVQEELDSMNSSMMMPELCKIFISAAGKDSVTISGPPSRLKNLVKTSQMLRYAKWVPLPVYSGLCHAPHVYTNEDAKKIVDFDQVESLTSTPQSPIISTGSAKAFPAKNARELLEQVTFELLTGTIRWDDVVDSICNRLGDTANKQANLRTFGVSKVVNDLKETICHRVTFLTPSLDDLLEWTSQIDPAQSPKSPADSKIAIVGMSCRFPGGANNVNAFWDLLEKGLDVHKEVPGDRFDVSTHYDPEGKRTNTSKTPFGCFIDEPGLFDAGFFNMSPREADQTDPMQRLALVTAHEALEMAGFVPNRTPSSNLSRVGVFYGQASDDYREVNTAQDISTYFIPGGCRAFGPGRINYFYKFEGPSFSADTACSSSLATIQLACTTLWSGDADTIVAGGMNVLTNSDAFAGLSNGHFLSGTGNCKTWDASADGYCRADGVGSIIMKRLEDAVADNDNILATINSAATNQSANAVSITHPHAGAQADLYNKIMNRASVDPLDVSYVELHGTGTQAGDATEMESVSNVFAPLTRRRRPDQPLHIGAVKSNVGHGEAAAGITALVKTLTMFQKETIPPHAGIKTEMNPAFKKDVEGGKRNLNVAFEKTQWARNEERKRYAVVNNFSAAGGNTTVLMEEAPLRPAIEAGDKRPTLPFAVSAKSKVSLKDNLQALIDYLDQNPEVSLSDLSYTTTARRMHYNHRITVTASDMKGLKSQLNAHLEGASKTRPISGFAPKVVFTFTGQGAFYNPIGVQMYEDVAIFRDQINRLSDIGVHHGFPSVKPMFDGTWGEEEVSPIVTQLTIVCIEIALAAYWKSLGITPSAVIGASLGEYAALHVAGVLSASDTIFLTGKRAQELGRVCEIGSHVMLAVRGSVEDVKNCLGSKPYEIACINAPSDIVIDGPREDMQEARKVLEEASFRCHQLEVPYAFHSAQMDPALDGFEEICKTVVFKTPNLPILSPLLGDVVFDGKTVNAKYMRRATREPVNFVGALREASELGTVDQNTIWLDIGPHPVCAAFVKNTLEQVKATIPTLKRNEDNWTTLAQSTTALHNEGVAFDWNAFHAPFNDSHSLINLPSYVWNNKNHWIQYNGTWALTKGNDSEVPNATPSIGSLTQLESTLRTSTCQQLIQEDLGDQEGSVTVQSDVMHPDFLEAAHGHRMNGCGVVTSSVHADIAYTLAGYIYRRLVPKAKDAPPMNIKMLRVLQGLVANEVTSGQQFIRIKAYADLANNETELYWYNVNSDGSIDDHFASATVEYGSTEVWHDEWAHVDHLVKARIETLEAMAKEGTANKLAQDMVYKIFGNLVDYAPKYRGMKNVILSGHEAMANVELTKEKGGKWTVPPYFVDSVAHLAGFIMNGSDASNNTDYFYVTPGWDSMRFAEPLTAGEQYKSYVKMMPGEPGFYHGDVYILKDDAIVGMVGSIIFRRFPRSLLSQFFTPPDKKEKKQAESGNAAPKKPVEQPAPKQKPAPEKKPAKAPAAPAKAPEPPKPAKVEKQEQQNFGPTAEPTPPASPPAEPVEEEAPAKEEAPAQAAPAPAEEENPTIGKALQLIANETGMELSSLDDEATFASMGVDSLMSLVLSEKFRSELSVEVKSSLFIECPTVGEVKAWMEQYC